MLSDTSYLKEFFLTVVISAVLSMMPLIAHAQSNDLTTEEVDSIIELLESFNVSEETVAEMRAVLEGNEQVVSSGECRTLDLSNTLSSGLSDADTNGEVSELQRFLADLGYFVYPEITGYFGSVTEEAVQQYQAEHNIVSSGLPETTGYGVVGSQTRESFRTRCDDTEEQEDSTEEQEEQESSDEEEQTEQEDSVDEQEEQEEESPAVSESDKSVITVVNPSNAVHGEEILVHGRNLTHDVQIEANGGEFSIATNFYTTELVTFSVPETWSAGTYQLNVTRPDPSQARRYETVEFTLLENEEEDTGSVINIRPPEIMGVNIGDTVGIRGVEGKKEFTLELINPTLVRFTAINDPCAGESCNTEPETADFVMGGGAQSTFFDITISVILIADRAVIAQFKHSSTSPEIEGTPVDDTEQTPIQIGDITLDTYIDEQVTSNPGTYTGGGVGTSTGGTELSQEQVDECGQNREALADFCFSTSIPDSYYPTSPFSTSSPIKTDPDPDSYLFEALFLPQYLESLKKTQLMEFDVQLKEKLQDFEDEVQEDFGGGGLGL